MSSVGLNTNMFRITSKYLELLNNFLVTAKLNGKADEPQKEQIIEFINELKNEKTTKPQFQLLANIIEKGLRPSSKVLGTYLDTLIDEVKADHRNEFLPKIEFLTDIFDQENTVALSKIIGE